MSLMQMTLLVKVHLAHLPVYGTAKKRRLEIPQELTPDAEDVAGGCSGSRSPGTVLAAPRHRTPSPSQNVIKKKSPCVKVSRVYH